MTFAPKARGYFLLNTDGGMVNDGNRGRDDAAGEAAIAWVLKDHRDRLVEESAEPIGRATNAEAEYKALIAGLSCALQRGVDKIRVFVDSEFVVDQMNGLAAPRSEPIGELLADAKNLFDQFPDRRISWIPRERNGEADQLVRGILYP